MLRPLSPNVCPNGQESASTSKGCSLSKMPGIWKPAPGAYAFAAQQCGVELIDLMLVAVHPWDIDGAHRAGLGTAWINRTGATYPDYFTAPTLEATSMRHLAQLLSQSTESEGSERPSR